jgi:thiamine biosynthesis lipoprotein
MHRFTAGAFDPTVKPLIDLLESGRPTNAELREASGLVSADGVRFSDRRIELERDGMGLTLDGVAKGYIVDRMSHVMALVGVTNHLVNAGGDIRTRGESAPGRPWKIAIEDPKKRGNYPDVVLMRDGAIATSGSYENFYNEDRTRHHIVDPSTGQSPLETVSVSVRAHSVMEADALSTAVFVMGPEAGSRLVRRTHGAEALVISSDNAQRRSQSWSSQDC